MNPKSRIYELAEELKKLVDEELAGKDYSAPFDADKIADWGKLVSAQHALGQLIGVYKQYREEQK